MSDLVYTLHINSEGISIDGDVQGTSPIVLKNGSTFKITYSNYAMTASMYGVYFRRKIYEPAHIQAEVMFYTEVEATDGCNPPSVEVLSNMLQNRPVELYLDDSPVASGYYIHEISPQYEKSKEKTKTKTDKDGNPVTDKDGNPVSYKYYEYSIYTKLDIYSPDKLLTLHKYCRAYLGRRFFREIMRDTISDFPLKFARNVGSQNKTKEIATKFATENTRSFQKIGYTATLDGANNSDKKVPEEMIYPYLIQYNETPYDFFRRVANRMGEVFYYDGGEFCYGLPSGGTKKAITNASNVIYQRVSPGPLTIHDYARDYAKEWDATNKNYKPADGSFQEDDVQKERDDKGNLKDKGYPNDAFARLPSNQTSLPNYPHFYNAEYATEDQYTILYKDKMVRNEGYQLWFHDPGSYLFGMLFDVLNTTTILDMLAKFTSTFLYSGFYSVEKARKREKQFETELRAKNLLRKTDTYAILYTDVDDNTSHWYTLDYYNDIKKKEVAQMQKMVCIDMGDSEYQDVKLGDKITLPNDSDNTYVVVQIDLRAKQEWVKTYDLFSNSDTPLSGGQSQLIYAIPLSGTTFYPPMLPDKPFRMSGPQPAFIADASDPLLQGRVRVRFAWQPNLPDQETAVSTAKSNMDTAQGVKDTAKTELEKYATVTYNDDGTVKTATIIQGKKEDDFKAALADYNTKIADYLLKQGKYNVALQNEASSPWIRMATPMATPGGGMYFRPEVGDEVMVDFENGNVERPYVVGCLYSKNVHQPPQGARVITSRNGHTIKLSDPTDGGLFAAGLLPQLKFLEKWGVWGGDKVPDLGSDPIRVLGGIELTDAWGLYNVKMSSHDRMVSISSPFGNVEMNAFTGISLYAPNGNIKICGKNVDISAYDKVNITSGMNIKQGEWWTGGHKTFGSAAGQYLAKTLMSSIIDVDKIFDLSLFRTLLEIFVRPVDGTLELKSYRYLLAEAGGGRAYIKPNKYKNKALDTLMLGMTERQAFMYMLQGIGSMISDFDTAFVGLYNIAANAAVAIVDGTDIGAAPAVVTTPNSQANLITALHGLDAANKDLKKQFDDWASANLAFDPGSSPLQKEAARKKIEALYNAMMAVKAHASKWASLFDKIDPLGSRRTYLKWLGSLGAFRTKGITDISAPLTQNPIVGGVNNDLQTAITGLNAADFSASIPIGRRNPHLPSLKALKRKIAFTLIEACRGKQDTFKTFKILPAAAAVGTPYDTDANWTTYCSGIVVEAIEPKGGGIGETFQDAINQKIMDNPFNMEKNIFTWERTIWDESATGEILFANSGFRTMKFNDLGDPDKYDTPDDGTDFTRYIEAIKTAIAYN